MLLVTIVFMAKKETFGKETFHHQKCVFLCSFCYESSNKDLVAFIIFAMKLILLLKHSEMKFEYFMSMKKITVVFSDENYTF